LPTDGDIIPLMLENGVNVAAGNKARSGPDAADILALSFPIIILAGILFLSRNRSQTD
jgi:hypothetical protein